jgi:hypothetical protein
MMFGQGNLGRKARGFVVLVFGVSEAKRSQPECVALTRAGIRPESSPLGNFEGLNVGRVTQFPADQK